ncbi:MAG: ParB family transcriptional regulator, chromosome partitioning protein [Epulopiscium sp.]|jgi:ParB family chromosome partitioning protein|uniref:Nucleoid occlusion protein n=1 Tax=Defluviitalea raffinosedens TaxID=1450156 RepID=A0A7C8HDR3_9FIRM|nr:nucleoid occlusion protein [Defluviitalea raffinosedens]KAE9630248.1 nucleoid occlusion protein [Defluviitalea raffinosedens]MBM7686052.1 ParB family chromosome partitioning protein [Defluviitalea raffinosedens]MDK2788035.1 ParB family transcriptional regulator, chromosome partitioning protein [Candidatus Epulonipiscium sp.]HHW67702.1 nucleoid occlusion protein [Candidatus Epulonipiscium sp.]
MHIDQSKELKIQWIPVDKIRPNPYQPRKSFDKIALDELTNSIREYGVMQPISVRMIGNSNYELVAGERRLRACKNAGMDVIPAVIIEVSDKDSAVLSLIENLQREELNFLEEADAYFNLMKDYGFTQEELAKSVGKSQSTIANKLRLLKLSPAVKKLLLENNLSERHARALIKLPDEEMQMEVLKKVIIQGLNVKKTEELVDQTIEKIIHQSEEKKEQKMKRFLKDIRLFTNTIQQAVDLIQQSGVEAQYTMEEKDDFYEINIKIPIR